MADGTGIEWTDATWNPIRGCSRVSEGCRNCYAERVAARFNQPGQPYFGLAKRVPGGGRWTGKVKVVEDVLDQPLRWQRPRRIFVNSMSDLFHEQVSNETIERVFAVMALAHWHTFQVLTKRPDRMLEWFRAHRQNINVYDSAVQRLAAKGPVDWSKMPGDMANTRSSGGTWWPLRNVWLGVSVEDQAAANNRIPLLMETPAAVRFLSCEPLLGPVDATRWVFDRDAAVRRMRNGPAAMNREQADDYIAPCIDWVIAGGESGPGARPMHPDWPRKLRDDCAAAGVPFFFKQWGEHDALGNRVGKKAAGSKLDGFEHKAFPREVSRG